MSTQNTYGNEPICLLATPQRVEELKIEALGLTSVDLGWEQVGELEMLMGGGYAPLSAYMTRTEYESVLSACRLPSGESWPLPLTLGLRAKLASQIEAGSRIALRDGEGFLLAIMTVRDKWLADPQRDRQLLSASSLAAGIELEEGVWHLGGELEGVSMPMHHDFQAMRMSAVELRQQLAQCGWQRVLAWLGSQPMHRAQHALCEKICRDENANLLLLPFGGGDLTACAEYYALIRTYQKVLPRFSAQQTRLAMLPIVPACPGLRGVWLRVILARNYGCTHVVIGEESVAADAREQNSGGRDDFDLSGFDLNAEAAKLGMTVIPYPHMQYVPSRGEFLPQAEIPAQTPVETLPQAAFLQRMQHGLAIPEWYAFPEVLAEMHRAQPPRERLGFCVFFTGLSGAGKSTLARALASRLMELGGRPVSLLDGDIVRRHLSSELGFSREHRDINVRRIGYVASEITKNRGVAICAPIAPYRQTRRDVRAMIEAVGGFIEVHVSTPLETCESRDRKGLYAKARAGLIAEFTGVSDPYEAPQHAEVVIDTTALSVDEALGKILGYLQQSAYVKLV